MTDALVRRTEITTETRSVTIVRTRIGSGDLVTCGECGRMVRRLNEVQAAVIFDIQNGEIERLRSNQSVHMATNADLCGLSLVEHFGRDVRFVED